MGGGRGGSECLDSDGLMPSDGRCISSDASACCLSSSCVVFLFLSCFFCFFLPPCASRKWLLYGDLCFMRHASAFSSVLRCFFLLFYFWFSSPNAITPSPLPRPRGGPLRSFCKVNMTEVAESLHELSRCYRVYTLVHAGFGTAV